MKNIILKHIYVSVKYQIRKNKIKNMTDDDLASDSESDSELDYESCCEEEIF